jgi:hypothetical protein
MRHIKLFEQFLNEDGYGRDFFVKKKDGKLSQYFFKIDGEDESLGFVVNLGKLSRNITIESSENSYAVLSVEPISENVMDDYLVKDSDFKSREDDTFMLTKSEYMRFYKIVSECIKDYLQSNPKVSIIYDEIPLNLDMDFEEYFDGVKSLIDEWSYGKWSSQEGAAKKTLIYSKRDHD